MRTTAIIALGLIATAASAQTKVQCHIDEQGRATAALIWQNTLGVERANAICRDSLAQSQGSAAPYAQTARTEQQMLGQHAAASGREAQMQWQQQAARAGSAGIQAPQRPSRTRPEVVHGRFEKDVYDRALAGRAAARDQQAQHLARQERSPQAYPAAPTPSRSAPMGRAPVTAGADYVPLEQSGRAGGGSDGGGYVAIW